MFKGIANLASLVKQAQQVGSKMQGISEELKAKRVTGSAGGGLVEAEVNGLGEVLKVRIDPKLVESRDREMIEDLIPAAVNQAVAKSRQLHAEAMKSVTAGMEMPGLDEALANMQSGNPPIDEK